MTVEDVWFSELRGAAPSEPISPANFDDRNIIRAHWDNVEQKMRDYLAELRDDMLFAKPIQEPEEDKELIVWQVLIHVANHGTDHRAQLLRLLNDTGVKTKGFYEGDLSLYTDFTHPYGWDRKHVRLFLENEFKRDPAVSAIVKNDPPVFTSNHAPFFVMAPS